MRRPLGSLLEEVVDEIIMLGEEEGTDDGSVLGVSVVGEYVGGL